MHSNVSFDFQDSEVSSADLQGQQFMVRFSAAHVHHVNNQDRDAEFLQSIELTIDQPTIVQKDSGCVGRLSQGLLRIAGTTIKQVPNPYEVKADVELELVFANGSTCKVIGNRIEIKHTGAARVMEWLKC